LYRIALAELGRLIVLVWSLILQLLSAGCPCCYYSDIVKECTCSATAIARYQKRISGPLLDRIDIHVEVPRVDYEKLSDKRTVEQSETIRHRVQAARTC
jgi:magnesium chelatase family protein